MLKSGPPVANLQQQDFIILDNKTQQRATSFQAFSGSQEPCPRHPGYRRGEQLLPEHLPTSATRSTSFCAQTAAVWQSLWRWHSSQIRVPRSNKASPPTATPSVLLLTSTSIGLRNHPPLLAIRRQRSPPALHECPARDCRARGQSPGPQVDLLDVSGLASAFRSRHPAGPRNSRIRSLPPLSTFQRSFDRRAPTLYSIDPLGSSEGLGRTFYYQQFCEGRQQGEPGYAGRPQPAGVSHANRGAGPQLQVRCSPRCCSNAWRTPRPTTGCPLTQLLPTIATSITVSKSS